MFTSVRGTQISVGDGVYQYMTMLQGRPNITSYNTPPCTSAF